MGKHKEKKRSKEKKSKKKKDRKPSTSSASEDEWVEKPSTTVSKRDDWMSLSSSFATTSNSSRKDERRQQKEEERDKNIYDPKSNIRELNPYWKDGGDGLPSFKKPSESESSFDYKSGYKNKYKAGSGWRKTTEKEIKEVFTSEDNDEKDVKIGEEKLNAIAAKLVKAEIMGNEELAKELKKELEKARESTKTVPVQEEDVLLTTTDIRGHSRPFKSNRTEFDDNYGKKKKKQKIETHKDGERVRYFPDDDKRSLREMFENEKYSTRESYNKEFAAMASKVKNQDMDEIFEDEIRNKQSESKSEKIHIDNAIREHRKSSKILDNCRFCIQSKSTPKNLIISIGETVYLTLPPFEPFTNGHCFIIPTRHVSCSTQLDENEFSELKTYQKSLIKTFSSRGEDVIFFETATNLHKTPHMVLECVPLPRNLGELAPMYFKKAIDESETEWALNKKLISLGEGRDVRRAVPRGLPYFWVGFGAVDGFAHVVEDEANFPSRFAREIVGGMLELDHGRWRNPARQTFQEQSERVGEFAKLWSKYDFTKQ